MQVQAQARVQVQVLQQIQISAKVHATLLLMIAAPKPKTEQIQGGLYEYRNKIDIVSFWNRFEYMKSRGAVTSDQQIF